MKPSNRKPLCEYATRLDMFYWFLAAPLLSSGSRQPHARGSTGRRMTSKVQGALSGAPPHGLHSARLGQAQVTEELQFLPSINTCIILTCNTNNNFSFA